MSSKPESAATADSRYDVIVVGGGTAGYAAAMEAARHGARVAVVEQNPDRLGGDSQVGARGLLSHLEFLAGTLGRCQKAAPLGLNIVGGLEIDEQEFWKSWQEFSRVQSVKFRQGLENVGIQIFPFRGFLTGPQNLLLLDPFSGDERQELSGNRIILATGRPRPDTDWKQSDTADGYLERLLALGRFASDSGSLTQSLDGLRLHFCLDLLGAQSGPWDIADHTASTGSSRFSEILAEFLLPAPGLSSGTKAILVDLLHRAFVGSPAQEKPPNTNLYLNLLGGRKLGLKHLVDGRIQRLDRSFAVSQSDVSPMAIGSCSAGWDESPAEVIRDWSRAEGVAAVKSVLGQVSPLINRVPHWISEIVPGHSFGICGHWRELGSPHLRCEIWTDGTLGNPILGLVNQETGQWVGALTQGQQSGKFIQSCVQTLAAQNGANPFTCRLWGALQRG